MKLFILGENQKLESIYQDAPERGCASDTLQIFLDTSNLTSFYPESKADAVMLIKTWVISVISVHLMEQLVEKLLEAFSTTDSGHITASSLPEPVPLIVLTTGIPTHLITVV